MGECPNQRQLSSSGSATHILPEPLLDAHVRTDLTPIRNRLDLGGGEESQNLVHDTSTLVGLEQKLRVRGAIQNDQFFRSWSVFVLSANAWKPRTGIIGVIAGHNEQRARFQLFCREVRRSAKKDDAVDRSRGRPDGRIASGCGAKAASNDRHGLGTVRFQIADCSEYVLFKGRVIEIVLAWTGGAADSTEVDCQNLKSF